MDFSQDSLFTLSPLQVAIVLLIGLVLACLWLFALMRILTLTRRFTANAIWVRVLLAVVLAWLFEWLSPQIYYLYYLTIFDGLPLQWVSGAPPWPRAVLRLLLIEPADNLSELGRALFYWVLLVSALLVGPRSPSLGPRS